MREKYEHLLEEGNEVRREVMMGDWVIEALYNQDRGLAGLTARKLLEEEGSSIELTNQGAFTTMRKLWEAFEGIEINIIKFHAVGKDLREVRIKEALYDRELIMKGYELLGEKSDLASKIANSYSQAFKKNEFMGKLRIYKKNHSS